MKIKMVFSDIDGTILRSDHQVSAVTRSEILRLEELGIPLVLVSARKPEAVRVVQQQIGNQAPIVCFSGGLVLDKDGKVLYSCVMELSQAVAIKQILRDEFPELCCSAYANDLWVADDDQSEWIISDERITRCKAVAGDAGTILAAEQGVHKLLVSGEANAIIAAELRLKASCPELSIARSTPNYLEIMAGEAKKSEGVKVLCSYYGISTDEVLAFGDGHNDLDMLQIVRHSYAMGNAPEAVKKSAAGITNDNDHDGVAMVLSLVEGS